MTTTSNHDALVQSDALVHKCPCCCCESATAIWGDVMYWDPCRNAWSPWKRGLPVLRRRDTSPQSLWWLIDEYWATPVTERGPTAPGSYLVFIAKRKSLALKGSYCHEKSLVSIHRRLGQSYFMSSIALQMLIPPILKSWQLYINDIDIWKVSDMIIRTFFLTVTEIN